MNSLNRICTTNDEAEEEKKSDSQRTGEKKSLLCVSAIFLPLPALVRRIFVCFVCAELESGRLQPTSWVEAHIRHTKREEIIYRSVFVVTAVTTRLGQTMHLLLFRFYYFVSSFVVSRSCHTLTQRPQWRTPNRCDALRTVNLANTKKKKRFNEIDILSDNTIRRTSALVTPSLVRPSNSQQ